LRAVVPGRLADPSACALELLERGFVYSRARHANRAAAWASAREVFSAAAHSDPLGWDMPALEVVGEFSVPPAGALRRDFQTLHIDFRLPIEGREALDVARFTALYVDARHPPTTAFTRVVPLKALLAQRVWPGRLSLLANLRWYGRTSHAGSGYVEGILARLVEAADECSALPSTADASFLCGTEFASSEEERAHFTRHRLELDTIEHRISLNAGELLLFDNLATAHGRVGTRRPNELDQLCVGYRGLSFSGQQTLLHRVLDAFGRADE
jgi:Taurine catabolism dioxygenase TauD, TfdA family